MAVGVLAGGHFLEGRTSELRRRRDATPRSRSPRVLPPLNPMLPPLVRAARVLYLAFPSHANETKTNPPPPRQGNFNGDNCLVGGRTMDYGPFGFMEGYDPSFAKWTGSGEHFAFANQPQAGFANWQVRKRKEVRGGFKGKGTRMPLSPTPLSLTRSLAECFTVGVKQSARENSFTDSRRRPDR